MSTFSINLPPGFELEQDEASGIKLPPGYELEQKTPTPEVKLPPGFQLEQNAPSLRLPPGFQLEQSNVASGIKLPPGFELEKKPRVEPSDRVSARAEQQEQQYQLHPVDYRPRTKLSNLQQRQAHPNRAPAPRTPSGFGTQQTNKSDSDADTRKFFEDAYSRFFDSDQAQTSSQNPPSSGQVGTHNGDRSWANAPPEVIARVHPPQASRSTAPPGSVQNSAQRPGAVSRFTDNMGQAMGVPPAMSDYWEGPTMAVTHPIESARVLTEAGNQAEQDLIDKAYWYQHQPGFGNKVKGLGYGIYSLIPFAGSSLAHAGEQFEQGDFASGFGTTMGVAGPSLIGAKGSVHEPSFGFTPGDSVVLPNGRPGTVQRVFPRMGVARVETESGPRTVGLSRIQRADTAVVDSAAQVRASEPLPLQLHPGDQVVLSDGRAATFVYPDITRGVARVHLPNGQIEDVRLAGMRTVRPAAADTELIVADSAELQSKINPHHQRVFRWNDASPQRVNKRKGLEWDFQRKTCGPVEVLLKGGGEEVWADGPITSEGLALDAKFVKKPRRSPFINDSNMPYDIRGFINRGVEKEFRRYAAIIRDPSTPVVGLKVVTNDRRAVPYLRSLMDKYHIPGRVVLR